ncbi:Ig-like domain-containing protein [Secundilactobacillus yichangensis]|uniref:Ig-like domain-containing protein n=1 Tax=Secundilactobacillus yichangensis TaxID=2799580 RepID=UPI0019412EC0|nr:Ig-like domain-containing protein [Secundilactobacillus yichangensis]
MKKLVVLSGSLIAAFSLLGAGAVTQTQASAKTTIAAGSPSLSINKIYSNSTSVTGKASKGVKIVVENSKKKQIASSTASKTTGKYTVKLPAKQKAATKLYVYAKASNGHYLYRIMNVQAVASKTTAKKSVSTKAAAHSTSAKKASKSSSLKTPTGTWQSNSYKGWSLKYTFSQKTGLNEYAYQGKKATHVLANARYSVDAKTPTFWKINVKAKGGAKSTFYMSFKGSKQFVLVNSKNQAVKTSIGKAPAGHYTFNLK